MVAGTLLSIIFVTNLFSVILPFVRTLLNFDPALASGPFITSVVDAIGLVIYFAWSSVLLFAFHKSMPDAGIDRNGVLNIPGVHGEARLPRRAAAALLSPHGEHAVVHAAVVGLFTVG